MGWRRKLTKFSMLQFGLTLAGRPQKARYGSSHYLSPMSVRRSSEAARGMANALAVAVIRTPRSPALPLKT